MYVKKPGTCSVDHRRAGRFRPKNDKKIPPEKDADCTLPGGEINGSRLRTTRS